MKTTYLIIALFAFLFQGKAQTVDIPDANFKNALINTQCVDSNGDGNYDTDVDANNDNEIQVTEALAVLRLNVSNQNITSLVGIEEFSSLRELYTDSNQITDLLISENIELEVLNCIVNNLTNLDVSQNSNLVTLYCGFNQLTDLDVSQNPNLTSMWCYTNQLTSLNIKNGNNDLLLTMFAQDNDNLACIQVDDVDFSNDNLTWLKDNEASYDEDCGYISMPIVDIPDVNFKNALISTLCVDTNDDGTYDADADSNDDNEIQVSEAQAIFRLNVSNQVIGSLEGIEHFSNLTDLNIESNQISSLNISENLSLDILACALNYLTSLDVSQNANLVTLECASNEISALNISMNAYLTTFKCNNNQLTSLNLRNGSNNILLDMSAQDNADLTCIQVDDLDFANENTTWLKDEEVSYAEDCNTLGVGNARNEFLIACFPNPVNDILFIQLPHEIKIRTIRIYNAFGQQVMEENSQTGQLDLSHLNNGMYFISVETKNQSVTKKIRKQ